MIMGNTTEQLKRLIEPVVTTIGDWLAGKVKSPNRIDRSLSPVRFVLVRIGIDG